MDDIPQGCLDEGTGETAAEVKSASVKRSSFSSFLVFKISKSCRIHLFSKM